MKYALRVIYSLILFVFGWLFNFVLDIQFALGVATGWLMKEGYDNIAELIEKLIKGYENIVTMITMFFK